MNRGDLPTWSTVRAVITYSYGTAFTAFAGYPIPVAGKSGTAETGRARPDAWFPAIRAGQRPAIAVATVLVHVPLATGGRRRAARAQGDVHLLLRRLRPYFRGD